jgi:hypothetical protein
MTSAPDRATAIPNDEETLEVVRLDERRGLGVRAREGFAAGSVMHRFAGIVSEQICQHSLQVDADRHISGTRYIGYLSHGCDPNAGLDMANFALVARRDITPGEIVTIDYADTEDQLHRQFACVCAATNCRGWITGRHEAPNDEGATWLGAHGKSPLPEREG